MANYHLLTSHLVALLCASTFATMCPGEGWIPYSDRCFKMVQTSTTYTEAVQICLDDFQPADVEEPMLLEIRTKEDQIFLSNFLFNISKVPMAVWIGAKRQPSNTTKFQWASDAQSLNFSNWAIDTPSDNHARGCIEMTSDLTRSAAGDWRDVTCEKANWVVCLKTAALSVREMSLGLVQMVRWKNGHVVDTDTSETGIWDKLDYLQSSLNLLQGKHDTLQSSLSTDLNILKGKHETLQTNHSTLQADHNILKGKHDTLQTSFTSLQTSHATLRAQHNTLNGKHNTLQTSFTTLQTGHNSLNSKHTSLQTSHNSLSTKVTGLESSQTNLGKSMIPIGFIFTQLPFATAPKTLWPQFTWTEVSSTYAGKFFRVVGGSAGSFGTSQSDAFQTHQHGGAYTSAHFLGAVHLGGYTFAKNLYKGDTSSISSGSRTASETRPINYSVKIWKRTA